MTNYGGGEMEYDQQKGLKRTENGLVLEASIFLQKSTVATPSSMRNHHYHDYYEIYYLLALGISSAVSNIVTLISSFASNASDNVFNRLSVIPPLPICVIGVSVDANDFNLLLCLLVIFSFVMMFIMVFPYFSNL